MKYKNKLNDLVNEIDQIKDGKILVVAESFLMAHNVSIRLKEKDKDRFWSLLVDTSIESAPKEQNVVLKSFSEFSRTDGKKIATEEGLKKDYQHICFFNLNRSKMKFYHMDMITGIEGSKINLLKSSQTSSDFLLEF